jgi:hypothetical protein
MNASRHYPLCCPTGRCAFGWTNGCRPGRYRHEARRYGLHHACRDDERTNVTAAPTASSQVCSSYKRRSPLLSLRRSRLLPVRVCRERPGDEKLSSALVAAVRSADASRAGRRCRRELPGRGARFIHKCHDREWRYSRLLRLEANALLACPYLSLAHRTLQERLMELR